MGCIFVDHRIGRRCIQHIVCGMFEIGDAVSDSKPMDDPAITACWYCYCIFVSYFHYKNDKGTNMVLSTIHAETELPFKMAPLIFISTTLTHLFGGSAGREGAALQLGGSIGNQLGRWFRFDERIAALWLCVV